MRRAFVYFGLFFSIFSVVFRSLIFNLSTHLVDWLDYPFVVWVVFQNIKKIKTLNYAHFFDTNAFYPNKLTLFFSDTLLPQSTLALLLSFLTDNPILVFNLIFIATFILNYVALFLFWNQIFKKDLIAFFGALFVIFSPFFHHQLGHFQMQSYWPLFLALFFLFKNEEKKNIKHIILSGVFLSIQFLSSVYLGLFLLVAILAWFTLRITLEKKKILGLKNVLLIIFIFLLIDGVFIKGYFEVKQQYNVVKKINPAHLSDYLFSTNINTLLYQIPIFKRWNSFNRSRMSEKAAFCGLLVSFLALTGILLIKKKGKKIIISTEINRERLFFILLTIVGFWFSLGPRLFFNGQSTNLPTGINLLVKLLPLLTFVRAAARWSFVFYLGVIYFALQGIIKIIEMKKGKCLVIAVLFLSFLLEYVPWTIKTHAESYINPTYTKLKIVCEEKRVVLIEYPVTHFNVKGGIIKGLNYITKVQLSSLYHGCLLVNGYSGTDPKYLRKLNRQTGEFLRAKKFREVESLLNKYSVEVIKINTNKLLEEGDFVLWKEFKATRPSNLEVLID